jgi:hypothetical protein
MPDPTTREILAILLRQVSQLNASHTRLLNLISTQSAATARITKAILDALADLPPIAADPQAVAQLRQLSGSIDHTDLLESQRSAISQLETADERLEAKLGSLLRWLESDPGDGGDG